MAIIVEASLFVDDSVVVKFDDGSIVQLSSCGSVFRSSSKSSPAQDTVNRHILCENEAQQLSQFTTTLWKERVKLALDFRNKFADVPYICRRLLDVEIVEKERLVEPVSTWPGADIKEHLVQHEDGSLTLKSLEGNSVITLSASRQTFTMKFLCQVPSGKEDNSDKYLYSWIQQFFSVQTYPRYLYFLLNILLTGGEGHTDCVVTEVPRSLPLHCKKAHVHRWRKQNLIQKGIVGSGFLETDSLKVLFVEGIVYRFFHRKYFTDEAILPDDSVIRSKGPAQLYFQHWIYDCKTEKVKENIYSIKALPLEKKDQLYSISKILKTAVRYLKYLSDRGSGEYRSLTCCWKSEDDPLSIRALSGLDLECSTYVPGLGDFKTYSNGRMHIVFSDGCIMDLVQPGERRPGKGNDESKQGHATSMIFEANLSHDEEIFKIILPNGISCQGSLRQPGHYHRYVRAAMEFTDWRVQRTEKTLNFDNDQCRLVNEELEKLRLFNVMMKPKVQDCLKPSDTCLRNTAETNGKNIDCAISHETVQQGSGLRQRHEIPERLIITSASDGRNMRQHLKHTRRTVEEIESVLENCRRHLTKL